MGCYSRPVERLERTRLFGRVQGDWQILALQVGVRTTEPVALVVPLPVVVGEDDAVRFLEPGASFFDELGALFDGGEAPPPPMDAGPAIESTFIASMADLGQLDPAYQLPRSVWQRLGEYWDYGFAVFRIPEGTFQGTPLALRFRTRARSSLFFPTVHVDEGAVSAVADFDHALYMQTVDAFAVGHTHANLDSQQPSDDFDDKTIESSGEGMSLPTEPPAPGAAGFVPPGWQKSEDDAGWGLADGGLVVGGYPIARRVLEGERTNVDTWVRV
jgi:hypothetical protein